MTVNYRLILTLLMLNTLMSCNAALGDVEKKNDFINIVVGNNPNIWEDEYNDYLNEPSEEKEESLNKKLRSLLKEICLMPEYYLS